MSLLSATTIKTQWPFSPQSIPGLQLWLDAADTSSLTVSSGSVTVWRDKSGNGIHMNDTPAPSYVWPSTGTAINGLNTVVFSAPAAMRQATVRDGIKNFYWVGRTAATTDVYFLFGADSTIDWHGNPGGPGSQVLQASLVPSGIRAATASQYTSGTNAVVNIAFSNVYYPSAGQISLLSVTGITGSTKYQGLCYDRSIQDRGWCGDLGEVLLFSNALTTQQHQQIEGYLAQKWGLQSNLPATHPYYAVAPIAAVPGNSGVSSPTAVANLALWLDGRDPAGTGTPPSNGATVSTWVDKSGAGRNATASGTPQYTTNSINGFPSIYLSNNPYFTGSIPISGSTLTCFAVAVTSATLPNTSLNHDQRLVSLSSSGQYDYDTSARCIPLFNQSSTSTIATWRNITDQVRGSNGIVQNIPFLAVSQYDGTNGYLWFNGSAGTSVASSPSLGTFSITQYGIGNQPYPTTEYWYGYVGEVLIYTTALSSTDRKSVELYLENKWGITQIASGGGSPAVPASQLYKQPIFQRTFSPVDISGCSLWLDGADTGSMTFTSGTSVVTAWKDKSGNAVNLTGVGGPTSTGNGVVFGANQYCSSSFSFNLASRSIFVVCITTSANDGRGILTLINTAQTNDYDNINSLLLNTTSASTNAMVVTANAFASSPTINSTITSPSTKAILYADTWSGTSFNVYNAGTSAISYSENFTPGTSNSVLVGARWFSGAVNAGGLNGTVFEVILYNSALSSSQRQQVESYLAWKWRLVSSLPTSPVHPGKLLPAFGTVFSPKSVAGMSLWLDAADSASISLSSISVSQWNDKSGSGRNVTQTTSVLQPTYSSTLNALVFNGNGYLNIPDALNSITPTYTVFVVERRQSGDARFFIGQHDVTTSNTSLVLGYNGSTVSDHTNVASPDCLLTIPAYAGASEPLRINRYDYSGSTRSTFINGGQYSLTQSSFSYTLSAWSNANVGAGFSTSSYWYIGNIHEIIFYKNVLTSSQAQQVEGYLAWKWGLVANLPSTHAFKNIKP